MVSPRRPKAAFLAATLFRALPFLATALLSAAPPATTIVQIDVLDPPDVTKGVNGLVIDPSARIWLTLRGRHSLGRIQDSHACAVRSACDITEFLLPDPNAEPFFVALDPEGDVWLTAVRPKATGLVYEFDPDSETFVQYDVPGDDGDRPFDIAVDSRGIVWFTDASAGKIRSINPATGRVRVELTTDDPHGIAIDENDTVWCACGTDLVNIYVTFDGTDIGSQALFPVPGSRTLQGIIMDGGLIWMIDQHANILYRFDRVSHDFEPLELPFPDLGGALLDPHWLVKRGDTIFYTGFAGVVGSYNVTSGTFGPSLVSPSRVNTNTGAYDITLDPRGRVWFTEVTANKLSHLFEIPQALLRPIRRPIPRPPIPIPRRPPLPKP